MSFHFYWVVDQRTNSRGEILYRYRCLRCNHTGRWYRDGNLADGDEHLWRAHEIGD